MMSKRFRGDNFWGRPDAIRKLLKELSDDESSLSGDESENDFLEVENLEFTDSDRDGNEDMDSIKTDGKSVTKTKLQKQTQAEESTKLEYKSKTVNANIPNFFASCDKTIIYPGKIQLTGKDSSKWSSIPKSSNTRTAARNIIHFIQGPKDSAKELYTPIESFSKFFTPHMLEIIVSHTNSEIRRKNCHYAEKKFSTSETCVDEIKALLGLLVLTAAMKNNHLPTNELFDTSLCGERYKAGMSEVRFCFLLNCLRFDSKETRDERKEKDKFAPIREFWDEFIKSCMDSYKPGSYVTIDEQLLAFRGRCPFRMYIPNKPAKYGIKIVMMCDVGTNYMVNAIPYLGSNTQTKNMPLASYFVEELTKNIQGTNRNITMDNWFTSIPLAENLLKNPMNLTIVGTVRKNKREIPPELLELRSRSVGTSMYCFDQAKTLLSYKTKPNRCVVLLSTLHEKPSINEESKKPEMIEFYNSTKGAVDTLDQMCNNMSSSRKTRRWPLCVFYGMINICLVNAHVIYVHNKARKSEKPLSRKKFAIKLSEDLLAPWMKKRLVVPTLPRSTRTIINGLLKLDMNIQQSEQSDNKKRKICAFCPYNLRRMTRNYCLVCSRAMCGEHHANMCKDCFENK